MTGFADLAKGTVYPGLTRLETGVLLDSRLVRSSSGPARKYYRITDAGRAELARATAAWNALAGTVDKILTGAPVMNLLDRARVECTLTSYDFWLDMRGVRLRARRRLVRELRANVRGRRRQRRPDGRARPGQRQGVGHLGRGRRRPRRAPVVDRPRLRLRGRTGGFACQPGWLCLVAALTAFVLVARPWRAVRRMGRELHTTPDDQRDVRSRPRSSAVTEWVSAPTEMKSTPVSA